MSRIVKRLFPLAAALLAAGCGSLYQKTDAQMHKVLGQRIEHLIETWGPPAEKRIIDGKHLVTFRTDERGLAPKNGAVPAPGSYCDSTVEVGSGGVVTGYYWDGSHCEAAANRL